MFSSLRNILGSEDVDPIKRQCFPEERSQVIEIVKVAHRLGVRLKAVSTGHNWGYSTLPTTDDGSWTVHLSKMNRIIDFDSDLGIATLEPGVTQGILKKYLDDHELPFMVPTTGAGSSCSIIGNILERGYGASAYFDSFASCMSLEAVLPNGELYRSPLLDLGGSVVGKAYKWGVGPHLDSAFSQSDLGICTSMNVALKRKPPSVMGLFFELKGSPALLVTPLVRILQSIGGLLGPLKITNHHRLLAIMDLQPELRHLSSPLEDHGVVRDLLAAHQIPNWQGFSAVYTDERMMPAVKDVVWDYLSPYVDRLGFINPASTAMTTRERIFVDLVSGMPNDDALPLAYFRAPNLKDHNAPCQPDEDGAGILWFAPLLPAKNEAVRTYLDLAHRIAIQYGFEPAISLTSLSDRCFDSVLPILFNGRDPEARLRAHAGYEALFRQCQEMGFVPYRVPSSCQHLLEEADLSSRRLFLRLKQALR